MKNQESINNLTPAPRNVTLTDGEFCVEPGLPVEANFGDADKLGFLLKLCGFENSPVINANTAPNDSKTGGVLYVHIGDRNNVSAIVPEYDGTEAYTLTIKSDTITVSARSPEGIAYGIKTLAKLSNASRSLPAVLIHDAPITEFRGVHMCIFNPDDGTEKEDTSPESIKKMILLAAMSGYNYVMLEFWGMFPYQRRPYACWPNELYTKDVVSQIISYAIDDLHITPLPCQNLTSHAGWSRIVSRKHVVLDQRPDLADMWIPGGWCFATENPDTKAYLKDIMEELLEMYRNPPFLHACCDKAFGFGSTEEDRTKSADILFGSHVSFLNSFLQERGTRMVVWADMLYTSMDALYWKANPSLIDMLPRNILMNLWTHNDPGQHWPDVDFFQNKGFQTIYSPFIGQKSIESMVDVCRKKNSYGILQTTWHTPQTARHSVVASGALQWDAGKSNRDISTDSFVKDWYR